MPLRLAISKQLEAKTDRVKSLDFHNAYTWVGLGLYSGSITIYDYEKQTLLKTVDASSLPVRALKFLAERQWIISGGDDMQLRVFNYNTMEKVKQIEAHSDYIRTMGLHSSLPYILTGADDMTIKLWNWQRDFQLMETFEAHSHYVMNVKWSPKDVHMFASASMDYTIKVWGVTALPTGESITKPTQPHYSLIGHERGVNCVEYYPTDDKPYIVSGSDDMTLRVWDYLSKQCIQILTAHEGDICSILCHPTLPLMFSGGEDKTLRVWSMQTYREEAVLSYDLDRIWAISANIAGDNKLGIACDEGALVLGLGDTEPVACLQSSKGAWAKGHEIQSFSLKGLDLSNISNDGEFLQISTKDLGTCEVYPQSMSFHPNGRYIVICGDGEYIIYTAQAMRNKKFGKAIDFVWSSEGQWAVREESGKIYVFENFEEKHFFTPSYGVLQMFGGALIGVKAADYLCFYDWECGRLVRKIDLCPQIIRWSDDCSKVALCCAESAFILRYDIGAVQAAIITQAPETDDGLEVAFELEYEIKESISSCLWISDFLFFVNSTLHVKSYLLNNIRDIFTLEKNFNLFGYVHEHNRIFLLNKDLNVVSYLLNWDFLLFQLALARHDLDTAETQLNTLPEDLIPAAAKLFQEYGHFERALQLVTNPKDKLKLCLVLGKLDLYRDTVAQVQRDATIDEEEIRGMWKKLGDVALKNGDLSLAVEAFEEAKDRASCFLVYSATNDRYGLARTAALTALSQPNIALHCALLLGKPDDVLDALIQQRHFSLAAFFARYQLPQQTANTLKIWKEALAQQNLPNTSRIAEPDINPELFH